MDCILPTSKAFSSIRPVSYTHLDVYKRQSMISCIQRNVNAYGNFASGGLEPVAAIGGSKNGLLRFLSFSAPVRSPLTHAQGVILAVHAAQNYIFKNCLRRLRTFFAKKVLRTPKNAQGII